MIDHTEVLIKKLNCISNAWKAQFYPPYDEYWTPEHFQTLPDLPLIWKAEDGILFLDDVWIAPVKYIYQENLEQAAEWVNPVAMEIDLIGGHLDIIITKWMGKYSIAGVERAIV